MRRRRAAFGESLPSLLAAGTERRPHRHPAVPTALPPRRRWRSAAVTPGHPAEELSKSRRPWSCRSAMPSPVSDASAETSPWAYSRVWVCRSGSVGDGTKGWRNSSRTAARSGTRRSRATPADALRRTGPSHLPAGDGRCEEGLPNAVQQGRDESSRSRRCRGLIKTVGERLTTSKLFGLGIGVSEYPRCDSNAQPRA